jgi:PKD domain/S-layer homology domain
MRRLAILSVIVLVAGFGGTSHAQIFCEQSEQTVVVALDDVVFADPPPAGGSLAPIAVLANDIIPTGTSVTLSVSAPLLGTATVGSGNTVIYRPNGTFQQDAFVYQITAGGETSEATVTLHPNEVVEISVTCTGIGCLFDARPLNGTAGIRNFVWSWDDGTPNAVGGSRQYHEYRVERLYTVRVEANYYSGRVARGSHNLDFRLARNLNWPVTVSGLGASAVITYNDLQTFPEGARGLDPKIWWSDYADNNPVEPRNVSIYNNPAHDTGIFLSCENLPECRVAQTYARSGTYRLRLQLLARGTTTVLYQWTKYITIENAAPRPRVSYRNLQGRHFEFSLTPRTDDWDVDEVPRDWLFGFRPGPYEWDFGDGTHWVTPDHAARIGKSYIRAGQYQVKLKVTDVNGVAGYVTQDVTVANAPPSPLIVASCEGLRCRFGGESRDDTTIAVTHYDFGDQTTSTTSSDHTYARPGCYTVTLTVTDEDGTTAQTQSTVSVAAGTEVAAGTTVVDARPGAAASDSPYYLWRNIPTTGNLNGILEPGEIVLVEPTWTTLNGQSFVWTPSLQSRPPIPTSPGFVARRYNHGQEIRYNLAGTTADCWAVAGCQAIGVTRTAPRATPHVDLTWTENRPSPQGDHAVTIHVGESFVDVPKSASYYAAVESVLHGGVTSGCSSNAFCPGDTLTRDQIAVWLLRAKYGPAFVPARCTANPFDDVVCEGPTRHWAVDWIARLKADGLTVASGLYEPARPVSRAEIAVFMLRAKLGSAYAPPACTQDYPDVPCGSGAHWAAPWISDLKRRVGTFRCDAVNYCPDAPVTRGAGAAFFSPAFALALDHRQCDPATVIAPAVKTIPATIIASSPAVSAEWAVGHAIDGNPYTDYASAGAGLNTFIDFDLGSVQHVVEVQFSDRRSSGGANGSGAGSGADTASQFYLIFSSDPVFGNEDDKIVNVVSSGPRADHVIRPNYGAGVSGRYVRYDVYAMHGGGTNAGAGEIVFKARVPVTSQATDGPPVTAGSAGESPGGADMSYELTPPARPSADPEKN